MCEYVAIARNYYYEELAPYFAFFATAPNKKEFIQLVLRHGFEPIKVYKLKKSKEQKLFGSYSPINKIQPN